MGELFSDVNRGMGSKRKRDRRAARHRGLKPLDSGAVAPMLSRGNRVPNGSHFIDKHGVIWRLERNDIDVECDLLAVHVPEGNTHRTDGEVRTFSVREVETLRTRRVDRCLGCREFFEPHKLDEGRRCLPCVETAKKAALKP